MFTIHFQLDSDSLELLRIRGKRTYLKRCPESFLLDKVDQAKSTVEIESVVRKYNLCDYCDFDGLSADAAEDLAKTAVKVTYRYPRIRSVLCFLGSKRGYEKTLRKLCELDRELIRLFQIQYVCTDKMLIDFASHGIDVISGTDYNGKRFNILAQAFSLGGILDGVILDEEDFGDRGYGRLCRSIKNNASSGYHPRLCTEVDSIIYHEFGHMLDFLCDLSEDDAFLRYYDGLSNVRIAKGLSKYATENKEEFFAEAFCEYMCSPLPGEMAKQSIAFLEKKYERI